MQQLLQDCRYAARMLRKNLGLTIVVVLSLGIGIGANSAIFSVVDALLLRPLPYPQSERLANIWLHSPGIGIFRDWPSPGQYVDIQNENHSFDEMAIARLRSFTLTGRERPERVDGMRASSSLYHMLGAKHYMGRLLMPDEDKPGKPQVAILSYRLWQRLFDGDPHIVGRSITLSGDQFTIAGVLTSDFRLSSEVMPAEGPMDKADVFLPLPFGADAAQRRGDENYNVMVRLKPGVTVQQAQADIDVIAARIREKDKRDRTFGMTVVGLQEQVVGDVRRAVLVLLGSVALVLLIACANVANLLLARAAGREKEIAIRTALGAGGLRIARQLLTESLLLAITGGAAGIVIARLTLYLVRGINPGNIPRLEDIEINGAVLAFTLGISVLTGVLFGVAPAWRALRMDLNGSLKCGGRSGQTDGGMRLARHQLRGLLGVGTGVLTDAAGGRGAADPELREAPECSTGIRDGARAFDAGGGQRSEVPRGQAGCGVLSGSGRPRCTPAGRHRPRCGGCAAAHGGSGMGRDPCGGLCAAAGAGTASGYSQRQHGLLPGHGHSLGEGPVLFGA